MRPAELAGDESPEWDAWQHFAKYLMAAGARGDDAIVSLPTTSPLRNVDDVRSAIALYESSSADAVVTTTEASRSPWFNMVTWTVRVTFRCSWAAKAGGLCDGKIPPTFLT